MAARRKAGNAGEPEIIPPGEVIPRGNYVPADRDEVLAQAIALVEEVDPAPEDDGTGIIQRLLAAETWEELDGPAKLPSGEDVAGADLIVHAVYRRPSDLSDSLLPYYLMIESADPTTGQSVRWQTSAIGLVVPLAKLAVWGKLPAVVHITQAEPTQRGYRPLNMSIKAVS